MITARNALLSPPVTPYKLQNIQQFVPSKTSFSGDGFSNIHLLLEIILVISTLVVSNICCRISDLYQIKILEVKQHFLWK